MIKFQNKKINIIKNPIFIIGINPGNQRKFEQTNIVWEGNRSADFLLSILQNIDNLFLTNLYNYQDKCIKKYIIDGLNDLQKNINLYNPNKIICLGNIVFYYVQKLKYDKKIINFYHPSYILRFKKDKIKYKNKILTFLEEDK
jgi:uracil-DNA glycosylase